MSKEGLFQARRRIAAFIARGYSLDTAVEDLPQELVYSFNVITEMLREVHEVYYNANFYNFAEWWKMAEGIGAPEDILRDE